jgi:hypothetical protein
MATTTPRPLPASAFDPLALLEVVREVAEATAERPESSAPACGMPPAG